MKRLLIIFFVLFSAIASAQTLPEKSPSSKKDVFIKAEKMPEYPGGYAACLDYLAKNIKHENLAEGASGRVYVGFVVDIEGKVTAVEIKKGIDAKTDREIIHVFKSMPLWTPGQQDDIPVNVQMTIPVNIVDSGN